MMKKRACIAIAALLIAALISAGGIAYVMMTNRYERSEESAAYLVIYSDMFDKGKGGVLSIDRHGGIIDERQEKNLQNVVEYSYEDGVFIAGGRRSNTHAIFETDGSMRIFHLLSNPDYSGVMSIGVHDGDVVAVMNGNDSPEDDAYLNLLVIEDAQGNVKDRHVLKMFAKGQVSTNDSLFIAGEELTLSSNRYQGKIILYDFATHNVMERVFDDNLLYEQPVYAKGKVFAIGFDMNGVSRQVDVFDGADLQRVASVPMSAGAQSLVTIYGRPWVVADDQACPIDINMAVDNDANRYAVVEDDCVAIPKPSDTHMVTEAIVDGDELMLLMRDSMAPEVSSDRKGVKQVGVIARVDIATDESQTVPVFIPSNRSGDSILFMPVRSKA